MGSRHAVLMMSQCNKWIHPVTKIQCNFFRWYPSSCSGSQSLSPTLSSSSQLHSVGFLPPPLVLSQHFTLPPAPSQVATPSLVKCLTSSCTSTRIRKGCMHQRCKHHCKERGGCLSHGNISPESTPTPHPLPTSSTSPHTFTDQLFSSIIDPSLQNPPMHIPLATQAQPPATLVSTRAHFQAAPTHASHMLPVFTERWAMEHSLREDQRKRDAEKLGNLQKTKHTVFVYAWLQVSSSESHLISCSWIGHRMTLSPLSLRFKKVSRGLT
jgi:hypothetical protein